MKTNFILWISLMATIQSFTSAQQLSTTAHELFESYSYYQISEIKSRRFTQTEMLRWLKPFEERKVFETTPAGQSAEGRTVSLLKIGTGPTKVLLWSQMHGDEPTATMALVDMMNFFDKASSHPVAQAIREKITLFIIPMLNPDGAERFQRRTAQLVDMNRDALAQETPEARILKEVRDRFQPEFGFNLHDQEPRYTVGNTKKVTTIALLAPAFNESRSDNHVRLPAKKVAATFAEIMALFIEGHISKYDDTFEPRAFGDNIQKWGTSTVLVESGGWPADRDKMFIRKLNYVGLLTALSAIATGDYQSADVKKYDDLPFNTKYLYDVIIRNALLKSSEQAPALNVDIGINIDEQRDPNNGDIKLTAKVVDVGDLSVYIAFEEIHLGGAPVESRYIQMDKIIPLEYIQSLREKK